MIEFPSFRLSFRQRQRASLPALSEQHTLDLRSLLLEPRRGSAYPFCCKAACSIVRHTLHPERLLLIELRLLCRSHGCQCLLSNFLGHCPLLIPLLQFRLLSATLFNADLGEPIDRALVLESGRGTLAIGASNFDAFDDSEEAG